MDETLSSAMGAKRVPLWVMSCRRSDARMWSAFPLEIEAQSRFSDVGAAPTPDEKSEWNTRARVSYIAPRFEGDPKARLRLAHAVLAVAQDNVQSPESLKNAVLKVMALGIRRSA